MDKLAGVAGVLVVVAVLWWSADHDKKSVESYMRYEECVQREYNTTPARWYQEHGELPVCE